MKHVLLLIAGFVGLFPAGRIVAQSTVITYEVGDFLVSTLSEEGQEAQANLLVGTTPAMLEKYLPGGTFLLEIQAFLIRTPEHTVLVDAGVGKNLSRNLKSLEVAEEKVDIILLTHAHGDHIGGLLRDGKRVFTNAALYIAKAEYDYWMNEKERGDNARKVFETYRDNLHTFVPGEWAKAEALFPGIQAIATYGHTPGHTSFLIQSAEKQLLIWGDILHAAPVQFPCPEVSLSFDTDRREAEATRKKVLEYVAGSKIRVAGAHIPFPAIGTVSAGNGEERYTFTPVCLCEGIY
jgi:glyoxylase-like metal-dependent hydrolase (beta-lactamase superfamily II)